MEAVKTNQYYRISEEFFPIKHGICNKQLNSYLHFSSSSLQYITQHIDPENVAKKKKIVAIIDSRALFHIFGFDLTIFSALPFLVKTRLPSALILANRLL